MGRKRTRKKATGGQAADGHPRLSRRSLLAGTLAAGMLCRQGADGADADPKPARLRAGAAATDITPELGVSLTGTILQIGPARSIHDRLHSRALVLDDGTSQIAIVVTDVTMVAGSVFDRAKALAHERTGIPTSRMLLSATHTHAAPRMIGIGTAKADKRYYDLFCERVAEAIHLAQQRLAPAEIGWGTCDVPKFPQNRRWLVKPGTMPPNPFGGTDDQVLMYGNRKGIGVRPAGPVDPGLSVVSVRRTDGRPLALLANYSIHYVGGYGKAEVSSDYFGCFAEEAAALLSRKEDGPPFVGILSNGTSGDTGGLGGGYTRMRQVARVLARESARIAREVRHERAVRLAMEETQLELGVRRPDAARLAWAEAAPKQSRGKGVHPWRNIYARETLRLAQYPPKVTVKLQALRIGQPSIVAIPCEVFAETGLAIKRESPSSPTFTISLANGYHGYLPTAAQHRLGGYETWPCRSSCLEVGAEAAIRAASLDLLRRVAAQPKAP